jgi:ubiquinone/menaquinone biosynthesis C-methylase UbiE
VSASSVSLGSAAQRRGTLDDEETTVTATTDRTTDPTTDPNAADRALKARHRAMWALGDYPAVAADVIPELGPVLVAASRVRAGDRVLDVGAGSGNAAVAAALTGAQVTASDLTPELFEAGRAFADRHGVTLEWEEGDAEALPYDDGAFDVVLSCVGVMFAPHHRPAADELVRVCRPGGTIGLLSWTPSGFIGQMFATMKPYAPPPPPGAQPPPLWGDEDHVRALLGDRVTDVDARRRTLEVDMFATPEALRDYFKRVYGPTIAVFRHIADDPEKVAALDRDLVALAERFDRGTGGALVTDWEYLVLTAKKSG